MGLPCRVGLLLSCPMVGGVVVGWQRDGQPCGRTGLGCVRHPQWRGFYQGEVSVRGGEEEFEWLVFVGC